jgi:hypothetical protein
MQNASSITLRPSWSKAGKSVLRRASFLLLAYVAMQLWLAAASGGRGGPFGIVIFLLIALVVMADYAYRMSTVLRVTKDSVTIKSLLPGQRVVPRAAIRGLALRDVYSYPYRRLIAVMYGEHGQAVAILPEGIWDERDLQQLESIFGSRDNTYRRVSSYEFKNEFPGAVKPYLGWALGIAAVVLIFGGTYFQSR